MCEFVDELIQMHNEESKDKALWEVWLHRVHDKSYADFAQSLEPRKEAPQEEVANIVMDARNTLKAFTSTVQKE